MFVILFSVLIGLVVIYHLYKYQTHWKHINKFCGPPSLPIIGNAHYFGKNPVENHVRMFEIWNKYGPETFRAYMGYYSVLVLTDPKDVEHVLTSPVILKKGVVYGLLYDWLGEGLLTSFGAKWFKHRKIITPSFHFKILQDFHEVMKKNASNLVKKLDQMSGEGEEIIDIQNVIHYSTLDVICETAMGNKINALDNNDSELVKAFQDMCYVIQSRAFNPLKHVLFIYRLCEEYLIEKKALSVIKTFIMNMIEKRRQTLEKNDKFISNEDKDDSYGKTKQAFLDTLLLAKVDEQSLTTQEIYEEVSTFMFEGHDTTTSGITFCVHLLSRNLDAQKQAYEEQVSIFDKEGGEQVEPQFQDMQEMKFLDMIIRESLRLYPSVPMIIRLTTEPIYLNGKYVIADTNLVLFLMAMGYNEKYFPDPYKFDPERFRDRDGNHPFAYVPFSAGPRNCIGQKFAMLEMKSVLSALIRNFEILPASEQCLNNGGYEHLGNNKYDPVLASLLTLKSDNGVHIRLKKRKL